MRKSTVLIALAGCLLMATSAMATLPSAGNSVCVFEVQSGSPCSDADAVWSPDGSLDLLCVKVTVRNALDSPLDLCAVRLDVSGLADPNGVVASDIGLCGSTAGSATFYDTTNANGAVEFCMTGGGCGELELTWTATALCATPEVELCTGVEELCVKSPEFTGDLLVNFFDTFKYLPQLGATTGFCADLNCDGGQVNFFDTFMYLPALAGPASCSGDVLPTAALAITCGP